MSDVKTKVIEMKQSSADAKSVLKAAGAGLLSFLFGMAKLFGLITPAGAGFTGGVPFRYLLTAAAGAVLGSWISPGLMGSGYSTVLVLVLAGVRTVLQKKIQKRMKPLFLGIITFTICEFFGILYAMFQNITGLSLILLVLEGLLAGTFAYFFALAGQGISARTRQNYTSAELAGFGVSAVLALSAVSGQNILHLNLGVMACVIFIFIAISRFGLVGGSVSSILAGMALCLYSAEMLEFSGLLVIAGFLAGAFAPLGKYGFLSVFIAVSTFALFLLGAPILLTYRLIDIFLATAVFVLLPSRLLNRISPKENGALGQSAVESEPGASARLSFASAAIQDLESELREVSAKFAEIDYSNISAIYDSVANSVCRDCPRALICWQTEYSSTMDAFNPMSDTLRQQGGVQENSLPDYFRERCCRTEEFCRQVNSYFQDFIARQNAKRQLSDTRRLVFEQFHSMSELLTEVSEEFGSISGYDEGTAKRLLPLWRKLESVPDQILCPVDEEGRTRVEVYTARRVKHSPVELTEAVSEAAGREFDLPSIASAQGKVRLTFQEQTAYAIEFSAQQSCFRDNEICGDQCEYFMDGRGGAYLLLSDGMGNGKRAAVDSVMTCSVLKKLLQAGFGVDSAVRTLNSALQVRSIDESVSTIDLVRIDLYTGNAEFLKAGAASSYLLSHGELKQISCASLPIGILQGVAPERSRVKLNRGDLLVLVSDGASCNGEDWIGQELKRMASRSADEISCALCRIAREKSEEGQQDDITILTARLTD